MDDANRIFANGSPNPEHFGFVSLRGSAGEAPEKDSLKATANLLGRATFFVDDDGYEREIIGAAVSGSGRLAYVESATKDAGAHPHGAGGRNYDVSIRIYQREADGSCKSVEIESYNPFFRL